MNTLEPEALELTKRTARPDGRRPGGVLFL